MGYIPKVCKKYFMNVFNCNLFLPYHYIHKVFGSSFTMCLCLQVAQNLSCVIQRYFKTLGSTSHTLKLWGPRSEPLLKPSLNWGEKHHKQDLKTLVQLSRAMATPLWWGIPLRRCGSSPPGNYETGLHERWLETPRNLGCLRKIQTAVLK